MGTHLLFAVDKDSASLTADDIVLRDAMERHGQTVSPHRWGDPVAPQSELLIRSTWDYVEHPERFRQWLDHLDERHAVVHNPTSMLRWSMHKGYLPDLAENGIAVVPTVVVRKRTRTTIHRLKQALGSHELVIKPAIGGTARLAIHTGRITDAEADQHLQAMLHSEDAIAQPYIPTITTDGELSVVAIAGHVTHTVRKTPARGDWRVQSDFGGRAERLDTRRRDVRTVDAILRSLPSIPTYARIDLVSIDDQPHVMELELIEPELFFQLAPEAAERLAAHLASGRSER